MKIPEIPRWILMMALVGRWRQRICIAIHQTQRRIYYARRVCCVPAGCLLRQWSILHVDSIGKVSEIDFFMNSWSSQHLLPDFCFHLVMIQTSPQSKHFKAQSAIWKRHSKRSRTTKDLQQLSRFQLLRKCVETFLNTKLTASGYERKISPHSNIMICWWRKRNEYQNNSRTLWGIHRLTRIEVISFQLQLRWQWMRSRKVRWKINQIKSSLSFVCAFIEKQKIKSSLRINIWKAIDHWRDFESSQVNLSEN